MLLKRFLRIICNKNVFIFSYNLPSRHTGVIFMIYIIICLKPLVWQFFIILKTKFCYLLPTNWTVLKSTQTIISHFSKIWLGLRVVESNFLNTIFYCNTNMCPPKIANHIFVFRFLMFQLCRYLVDTVSLFLNVCVRVPFIWI